jgi:acylphosphatase
MPEQALHLRIRGLVQGVGYRHALCRQAEVLGLIGWVRNRSDGSVEALAVGDAAALDQLRRWAHDGPPAARVSQVEATPGDAAEHGSLHGFVQRATE